MIGRLVGRLVGDDVDGAVLLDVAGVGYEVLVPLGALGRAQRPDPKAKELQLFVHTHVREDALQLFGFASLDERAVFRLLIGLPSVGPKLALAVLSALPPVELAAAVATGDLKRLNRVQGVGKKTAERLILELKEKLPNLGLTGPAAHAAPRVVTDDAARLRGALTNMGYKPAEAERAVATLEARIGHEPLSDLLRGALAELTK